MQHLWWLKKTSGLLVGLAMLGCSPPADTIAQEKTPGIHLPGAIVRLVNPQIAIGDLKPDLVDKSVQVRGTVLEPQVPLLEGTLYRIADTTGEVWVFSLDAPPEIGAVVQIDGVLQYEEILVGGVDISEYYLQEQLRSPVESSAVTE